MEHYGWIYSTKEIADFKRVTLDEVYELPVTETLYYLSYLKAKRLYDDELLKRG
jgi:hypothetical protein